jgi:hypothetical protein
VYQNQQSRQTGSRNLMGPKTLPTIWGIGMKLVTKYQIKYQSAHRWPRTIRFNSHRLVLWSFLGLSQWVYVRDDMSKGLKIMSLGVINHGVSLSVLYPYPFLISFLVLCNIDLPLKLWSHVIRLANANGIMSILSEGLQEWVLILENVNRCYF